MVECLLFCSLLVCASFPSWCEIVACNPSFVIIPHCLLQENSINCGSDNVLTVFIYIDSSFVNW